MTVSANNSLSENQTIGLPQPILSYEVYTALSVLLASTLTIDLFGLVGCVLIIAVYTDIGFADSTNISLVALALSELSSLTISIIVGVTTIICTFRSLPISEDIIQLIGAWPYYATIRITAFITAFLSLERCLCVLVPLKVKRFITRKVTFYVMVSIFVITILPVSIMYFKWSLGWKFSAEQNRMVYGLVVIRNDPFINSAVTVGRIYFTQIIPAVTSILVAICTVILIASLHRSRKWRNAFKSGGNMNEDDKAQNIKSPMAFKEERTVKIVILIAITFVGSMIPIFCSNVATVINKEYFFLGRYKRLFFIVGYFSAVLESLNASINFVIYYRMSSKFKKHLLKMLKLDEKESHITN